MITWKEAFENPELMIKYKEELKDEAIFTRPWCWVFWEYPYLYREFSDRFDKMDGVTIANAVRDDPTLVSDLKDYLHKLNQFNIVYILRDVPALALGLKNQLHKIHKAPADRLSGFRPDLSLCLKYRDDVDKIEAAYYIGHPHELDDLNKEEKREILKKTLGLLRGEKT